MTKKILSAAIAASFAVAGAASAEVKIYGKLHQSLDYFDGPGANNSRFVLQSNGANRTGNFMRDRASRIGFKGSEDLGDGLKFIWKLEYEIGISDSDNTGINDNRNTYLGLTGSWGTAVAGRHDTPYKIAFGKFDLFADRAPDFNAGLDFADARSDNAIAYISPSFNGLTLAGAIIPGEQNGNGQDDGLADAYSLAAIYKNNGIMASLAYENVDQDALASADDSTFWSAALGYKANGFYAGVRYENGENEQHEGSGDGDDHDRWYVAGSYKFGNNVVKAQWGQDEADAANITATQWTIGIDHNFTKRTTAYALFSQFDEDGAPDEENIFSLGMIHKF